MEKKQPQALLIFNNNEIIENFLEHEAAAKTLPVYRYFDLSVIEGLQQLEWGDFQEEATEDSEL